MSQNKAVKEIIGKVFNDIADAIETGKFSKGPRIGLTLLGSQHGIDNLLRGAEIATNSLKDYEVVLIGPKVETTFKLYEANTLEEAHKIMEGLLEVREIDACVTMQYNFPIGISTVGKVITPGRGKEMFIATTTGVSSSYLLEAMVKNAIYGIVTAKANGIKSPKVGILNVEGARHVERALKELKSNGYNITFVDSQREDGSCIMRGNDLLTGTPDVMVQDTLTGNILMKMLSAYTTGGNYESVGYGYGPGIGEDEDRIILILSRSSGAPVVANALQYAAELVKGNLIKVTREEFKKAKKANLEVILKRLTNKVKKNAGNNKGIVSPSKEIVTNSIVGIDIMDIEDAEKFLWEKGIYVESGMGCTGPVLMVNEENLDLALEVLRKTGYIVDKAMDC